MYTRGGQKTADPDPPDQSGRFVRPPVNIYMDGYGYFKYSDNRRITDFGILVRWIPARPTKYIYIYIYKPRAKLIYSSLGPVHPVTLLKFGHVVTQNKTQTDVKSRQTD